MTSSTFFTKIQNPFLQLAIVLVTILLVDLGTFFLSSAGVEIEQAFPWTITATFILFFAMFNSIISLLADNMDKYWTKSILSYIALVVVAGLIAWGFSSLTINEAGSYRWIYIVLTFGYLLFLSMIAFMKKIVEFAQKEEWNQPRLRKKKKK